MKLMSEAQKIDIALTSANLNGASTGAYYKLDKYGKALFVVEIGAMAAAATSALQVMQATNAAAGGPAKAITNNTATITANTGVAAATLTCAAVNVGDTCVINGLTFTAAAAADLPNRVFSQSGDDTADAASLVAAINHATAGVPGVTASSALGVVTLVATEPGENNITVVGTAIRLVAATLRAVAYVECDASFLDTANNFTHVALRVTNSAAMQTGAVLLRGQARYSPRQHVAASKVNVNP